MTPVPQAGRPLLLGPYEALLFDMDGTLLTSLAAVDRAWSAWAKRAGLPPAEVVAYVHGRTAFDTMRHFLPDAGNLEDEARWLDSLELQDLDGIAEVPGAGAFLRSIPENRWAVVTSATRALALARISAAGLPLPSVLISSNDVARGKPDPEGYLKAALLIGADPRKCLVLEDTEAGIGAGLKAGADVVQIAGTRAGVRLPVKLVAGSFERMSLTRGSNTLFVSAER